MVLVVAHRGSNTDLPEHSLAAYLRAIDEGADAVECDVRLTVDGTAVLVHDRSTLRTTGLTGVISRASLGELFRHDWSAERHGWKELEPHEFDESASSLLTLRTLLLAVSERSATMGFSIETKHPTRYRGFVEREVTDVLRALGLTGPVEAPQVGVRVMSFSAMALYRMRRYAPSVPRVFLMEKIWPWRRDGSLPAGASAAGISIDALLRDPGYVKRVQGRGGQVHVWTVDAPEDVQACLDAGVDAIISNRPALVRRMAAAFDANSVDGNSIDGNSVDGTSTDGNSTDGNSVDLNAAR